MLKSFTRIFTQQLGKTFIKSNVHTLIPKQNFRNNQFLKLSTLTAFGLMMYNTKNYFLLDDFYEKTIDADFQEGEKRAIQVGPQEADAVLVVKYEGKYFCVSNKCSHFGFSLAKGNLYEDKIICPLHLAAFSVQTGQHEYGPVFKGLETFEITEKDGKLHIKVPVSKLNVPKTLQMSKQGDDKRRFIIIGGGPAGLSAAETLRQSGFEGEIRIIAKEQYLTYDRTSLSKDVMGVDIEKIKYRDDKFYKQYDIHFQTNSEVTSINYDKNYVQTRDGQHIHYEGLLIASGGRPIVPKLPGTDLERVFTLREWNDMEKLKTQAKASKKIVIIGASFIGLEAASSLKMALKDQIEVTVCDFASAPYERVLGKEIGQAVQKIHETNGIKFKLSNGLKSIEGEDGNAKRVVLTSGEILEADMVLIGAGMRPNTEFTGALQKEKDGGVQTNFYQQTSKNNVWAAGDIASYPYFYTGANIRTEHYNEAIYQGYIAALNMLGKKVANESIPFFWTRFWNKSLTYTGYAHKYDKTWIQGDLDKGEFICWYFLNNAVIAAAGLGVGNKIIIINEAMKRNLLPRYDDLHEGRVTLEDIEKKVKAAGKSCKCQRKENCSSSNKK